VNATPVNLYVDRLMTNSPNTAEEVWNATQEHSKIYSEAARKVGLSGPQYQEFQQALLDGKAVYVRLPAQVDTMAGLHHGHPYALKSVSVPSKTLGWKVALADGTTVYIPQVCGNLSLVRRPAVAQTAKKPAKVAAAPHQTVPHTIVTQASTYTPSETAVTFQPPMQASTTTAVYSAPVYAAPVAPAYAPAPVYGPAAVAAPAPSGGGSWLPFLVPVIAFVGGSVNSVSSPPTTVVPPCSQGSNALGVCQGR
jgi:hypothetical protein